MIDDSAMHHLMVGEGGVALRCRQDRGQLLFLLLLLSGDFFQHHYTVAWPAQLHRYNNESSSISVCNCVSTPDQVFEWLREDVQKKFYRKFIV